MAKNPQTNKALIARVQRRIDEIYRIAAIEAAKIGTRLNLPSGSVFSLCQFPTAKRRLEQLMAEVDSQIRFAVLDGVAAAWAVANRHNDETVNRLFGKSISRLPKSKQRAYLSNNDKALEAFKKTRVLKIEALSEGVWKQGEALKQIESAIGLGLSEAKSAAELSRDIRRYLREPNRLYRRVRDAEGKLQLSQAAKEYHPGAGVYRSSYKNAMRVARTEINAAYHTADQLRWDKMDFVVGVRISLSGAHPAYDICDELQGDYPKNFKFTGWHPNCLCQMTAILKTEAEMDRDDALIMAGKEPLDSSTNEVKDVPKVFKDWIETNRERAKGWMDLPYFMRDNPHYVGNIKANIYTAAEKVFTRATKTALAMKESLGIYMQSLYPHIPNIEKAAIYHFTRGDVSAYRQLNNQLRKGKLTEFNKAFSDLISKGLSKIGTTTETTYRLIRLNKTGLRNYLEIFKEGKEAVFEGFTSSSFDRLTALKFLSGKKPKNNETDVLLVIHGKSGHPIEKLSQFGGRFKGRPNQREVLFNKGFKFKIIQVMIKDKYYEFHLKEV